ncbi:hypothetical protein NRA64_08030 [Acinetobacter baumannii]|nr:hypothetical protein [Acinetobacter baumannii]
MLKKIIIGLPIIFSSINVFAIEVSSTADNWNLDLGGAIRTRFDFDPDRDIRKYGVDTIILKAKGSYENIDSEIEYRFMGGSYPYNYTENIGDINFPKKAYIQYKWEDNENIQIGLNQVPIGIQPYFTSTMIESIGYTVGLEDLYKVGIKYHKKFDQHELYLGYYWDTAWNGKGTSNGTTYSNVITKADTFLINGTNYEEKDTYVAQYNHSFETKKWNSNFGLTAYHSKIEGIDQENGTRDVIGLHYVWNKDAYGIKFLTLYQNIDIDKDYITFGGYDGTYNVATEGYIYSLDASYKIPSKLLNRNITDLTIYANYSAFDKRKKYFLDSQQIVLGSSFLFKNNIYTAVEWLFGKNNPYIGGSSYTESLATGGTNHWENQMNINIGYYF